MMKKANKKASKRRPVVLRNKKELKAARELAKAGAEQILRNEKRTVMPKNYEPSLDEQIAKAREKHAARMDEITARIRVLQREVAEREEEWRTLGREKESYIEEAKQELIARNEQK